MCVCVRAQSRMFPLNPVNRVGNTAGIGREAGTQEAGVTRRGAFAGLRSTF